MEEKALISTKQLQEENQRLKEQIKALEFEKDVKYIYKNEWSDEICEENYGESGLLTIVEGKTEIITWQLHKLFLKYGYDYVDNYFKKKNEKFRKSIEEEESEE